MDNDIFWVVIMFFFFYQISILLILQCLSKLWDPPQKLPRSFLSLGHADVPLFDAWNYSSFHSGRNSVRLAPLYSGCLTSGIPPRLTFYLIRMSHSHNSVQLTSHFLWISCSSNSIRPTFRLLQISHIRIRPTFHLLRVSHIRTLR